MASSKTEGPELKKLIKLGKKQTMPFAFCPGKKMEEHVVMIDRRKSPTILGKAAKAEGTAPKVSFGTFEVKGKIVEMTCERVVPKMAKTLKAYFKTQKISVNVVILDADGNTLESEIEELPVDAEFDGEDENTDAEVNTDDVNTVTDEETDSDTTPAFDPKKLAARLKAIQPAIVGAPAPAVDKLKAAMGAAVSQIKADDLTKADQTITALETAIARLGATAPAAPPPPEPGAPDARALAARASSLKQTIDTMAEPAKGKLLAALGTAAKSIKAQELATADQMLSKIEAAVNRQQTAAPEATDPNAAKWAAAEAKLQPLVDKAMTEKRGDLDGINRAFNYAKDMAADGAYDKALASVPRIAELLKAAQSATTTAAADEAREAIPDNVVPYVKSRLSWIKTRQSLKKELEGLKSAIDAATRDVEGLEEVSSKSSVLFDYLDGIDTNLEDTLEKLVEAPDGPEREALKSQARDIIATYRTVLDSPFFHDVDENGFVQTNIRGSALQSLDEVSTALAA